MAEMMAPPIVPACLVVMVVVTPFLYKVIKDSGKGVRASARLGLTLPLLPALFVLNAKLPFAIARQFLCFPLCLVMPVKLVIRCFDNYAMDWSPWTLSTFPRFIASALIATPKVKGPCSSSSSVFSMLGHLLREVCLVIACMHTLLYLNPAEPSTVLHYPFHFFFIILAINIPTRIAALILRLDLRPSFNQPLKAQSISEFWGQRWSLTSSGLLRELVYNPVLGFLQARPTSPPAADQRPGLWMRVTAVFATFFVSGLLHELTWFCTLQGRNAPSWEVFFFFLFHGVLNSAEIFLRRLHPQLATKTPAFLKFLITQGLVHTTFRPFFFGPLVRGHLQMEALSEYTTLLAKARLFASTAAGIGT